MSVRSCNPAHAQRSFAHATEYPRIHARQPTLGYTLIHGTILISIIIHNCVPQASPLHLRVLHMFPCERSHRSLSPSANRPAQLAGLTHPPQARRPHPHCPPSRRDVPRAVAAPSPAFSVSQVAAVDSVATWVLRLSRDGHIGSLLGL